MKTIHKINFQLLALLALFVTACTSDDVSGDKGEPAVISLSMSDIQTRGSDLFAGESLITKVRVYVFDGNYVDKMQVFTSGEADFNNPFKVNTTTGPKTVYVVANEPSDMTAALNDVMTKTQLNALATSASTASLASPFTMVGSENVTIATTTGASVTVSIKRLVAKINLTVKKGATNAEIFLKSVRLYRGAAKSALIEEQPVSGQTYWNCTYTPPSAPIALATTGSVVWGDAPATSMYVYENLGSVTDTLNRATYLMIDALYNGVDTRYRAYINDNNSDAVDHKYSVKRNHQYNLEATITNIGEFDGLVLTTQVMPWTLLTSNILFDRIFNLTITPTPTISNHTYIANTPADLVTFTFKLDNPVGAVWYAQLTNPTDFEFSTAGGAATTGGIGTTYTISIKPRNAQGAAPRTTEFFIIVGGPNFTNTEIPLIQGNALVGTGNRIIINQQATP